MSVDQQQQAAQRGRRRWVVAAVAGCLLVAAAVLAGVLSTQMGGEPKAKAQPLSDNVLDTLAQLNAMPKPPALPAKDDAAATTVVTPVAPVVGAGDAAATEPAAAGSAPVEGSESALGTLKDLINSAKAPTAAGATAPAPAPAPAGSLTTRGWEAIGGSRNTICYPTNGTEVVQMTTAKSPCTVIVLTRGSREPYNIKQIMNITSESPGWVSLVHTIWGRSDWTTDLTLRTHNFSSTATKIIVGNPIDQPALNASKIERLFYGMCLWVQAHSKSLCSI